MLDWYLAHQADIQQWVQWGLANNAFRKISALMYVIFAVGLFSLGAQYHAAVIRKEPGPGQFAHGYFTMLTIQLVPLTITGFVLQDEYIIGTRLGTLAVVIVVYGMISSRDGTFEAWRYRVWMTFWLSVAILGPMVWLESIRLRVFVHDYQNWIAWLSVIAMVAFVVRGQWVIVVALFRHFVQGHYTIKRFSLQVVRFLGFAFQAIHYWYAPTTAAPFFGYDPIFLQGLTGALGAASIVIGSLLGLIWGTGARRRKRSEARSVAA
ncbi:MAG TPA: hypothetical protein VGN55_02495 [Xanthobacteraceae bacterium]|jgi:hypothetical protein